MIKHLAVLGLLWDKLPVSPITKDSPVSDAHGFLLVSHLGGVYLEINGFGYLL